MTNIETLAQELQMETIDLQCNDIIKNKYQNLSLLEFCESATGIIWYYLLVWENHSPKLSRYTNYKLLSTIFYKFDSVSAIQVN